MNNEQSVLLSLIKQSQFGPSGTISFIDVDLDTLYKEASQQAVLSLIAPEIPNDHTNKKWIEAQYRQKAAYILYCNSQDDLKTILDNADIPFVILKGNSSAISYTDPSRRSMGDIDILVPQELYLKTKSVLSSSGYIEEHDNGRHASFKKDKQSIEVHHHFSNGIDVENYLIAGLKERKLAVIDGHEFPMLPRLANGIVLLDHFRKHLLSSVGIRQVIDWMMYVYHELNDDFWFNDFEPVAKEKGLDKLAITLTRMCQLYLGLPKTITWCSSANENLCNRLLKSVFDSGNFGRKKGKGKTFESVLVRIQNVKGLFKWLQTVGERTWDSYKKHHWLKPFCWIYQFFRFTKKFLKSGRTQEELKNDINNSNERYELLKDLNVL